MKTCTLCMLEKSLECFAWRNKSKGTRRSECKECRRVLDAERWRNGQKKVTTKEARARNRERKRDYIWDILTNSGCTDCGESNPIVLEFDHLRDKDNNICTLLANEVSLEKLKTEISKCEVVCKNCHAIRTAQRGGFWKYKRLVGENGVTQQ